jgi:hypothetical protein
MITGKKAYDAMMKQFIYWRTELVDSNDFSESLHASIRAYMVCRCMLELELIDMKQLDAFDLELQSLLSKKY